MQLQHEGKIVTNKIFVVHHSNVCVELLLTGYAGSLRSQGVAGGKLFAEVYME